MKSFTPSSTLLHNQIMIVMKMNTNIASETHHILMIPFLAQGHIRPFLELAILLINKRPYLIITLLTTPLNADFLRRLLRHHGYSSSGITIVELPFNPTNHGLPRGIENTDKLPLPLVISLFHSTTSLEPHLRDYISRHFRSPPLCIIHDVFLGWAGQVAKDVGSTGVAFTTGGAYGTCAYVSIWNDLPHRNYCDDQEFPLFGFPENHKFRRSQLHRFLRYADGSDEWSKYFQPQLRKSMESFGWLCNSVEEMEPLGFGILKSYTKLPIWGIGPLIASPDKEGIIGVECVQWLSSKEPDSVLYISFGSQNTISPTQMMELAAGLELSGKPFLWVIRAPFGFDINEEMRPEWLPEGFEERMKVKKQGMLVHKLGPQLEILNHESTGGFLTHCGWNSILESLREGVPMLGWPLAAEQAYNLKYLEEEMGVAVELARGLEGEVSKEKVKGIVEMVLERNEGSKGLEMKKRAVEMGKKLKEAINEDKELKGSCVKALDDFIHEIMQQSNV